MAELPFINSTVDNNGARLRTLFDGLSPGFNATDNLENSTLTTFLDLMNAVNLTTLTTQTPLRESFGLAISASGVKMYSHITRSFINPVIGLVGCIGNSFGVGVLWRQAKQQKLSIFWYLCTLTLVDILFLSLAVIDGIPRVVQAFDKDLAKYLIAHFRLGIAYFDMIFLHTARYVVLVMSCERLISVIRPLHVKDTWLAKYPVRIMFICLLFNAVFLLPIIINATVVTKLIGGQTEYIFTFRNYDTFMGAYWVAQAAVHSFIPMIFLVPINIAIPVQFYRASAKLSNSRSAASKNSVSQQRKITATVLAITTMYIFLSIPLIVVKILQYVNPDFNMNGKYRLVFWLMVDLGKCLAYINAANDFLVFFLVSNSYRSVFMSMYCKCRGSKDIEKSTERKFDTDNRSTVGSKESSSASKETFSSNISS